MCVGGGGGVHVVPLPVRESLTLHFRRTIRGSAVFIDDILGPRLKNETAAPLGRIYTATGSSTMRREKSGKIFFLAGWMRSYSLSASEEVAGESTFRRGSDEELEHFARFAIFARR